MPLQLAPPTSMLSVHQELDCPQAQKKGVLVLPPKRGTECLGHFTDTLNLNILYISFKLYKNGLLQKNTINQKRVVETEIPTHVHRNQHSTP